MLTEVKRNKAASGRNDIGISANETRVGSQNEHIIAHGSGRYQAQVAVGDGIQIVTPPTGVALAAASGITATPTATAQPVLWFLNKSGKNISINKIYVGTISGTPLLGSFWACKSESFQTIAALSVAPNAAANSAANIFNPLNLGVTDTNLVKVGVNTLLTGLVGNLRPLRPVLSLNTVTASLGVAEAEIAGQIIVRDGELFALMAPAGTPTHTVCASIDAAFQTAETSV